MISKEPIHHVERKQALYNALQIIWLFWEYVGLFWGNLGPTGLCRAQMSLVNARYNLQRPVCSLADSFRVPHFLSKEPYIPLKEPCILSKGLYNPLKSPIFFQKSPVISEKGLTFSQKGKSPVISQKGPIFSQKSLIIFQRALCSLKRARAMYFFISKRAL